MILTRISTGLVCFTLSGVSAFAAATLSPADRHFMTTAADDNMIEAHIGQMAESQAATPGVKDFAKKLADDHSKAYTGLLQLSEQTGDSIPRGINIRRDRAAVQLTRLQSKQFDRAFLRDEISDHEKAIAAFRREAAHGQNAEVKAWASKMIPVLQDHLNMARELAKSGAGNKKMEAKKI